MLQIWLFEIIEHFKLGESNRKYDTEISKTVEALMHDLLHSKKPKDRNSYLAIVERMMYWRKNKISKQWSEGELAQQFNLLNERLTRFVAIQETDEKNLLYMADIIFNVISVPNCEYFKYIFGVGKISP